MSHFPTETDGILPQILSYILSTDPGSTTLQETLPEILHTSSNPQGRHDTFFEKKIQLVCCFNLFFRQFSGIPGSENSPTANLLTPGTRQRVINFISQIFRTKIQRLLPPSHYLQGGQNITTAEINAFIVNNQRNKIDC
jgi:hypothetical protein